MRKVLILLLFAGIVATVGRTLLVSTPPTEAASGRTAPHRADRTPYILTVSPAAVPEGTVYHVRPTRAGRLADRSELDTAWQQAVARGVPDRANLRQQFLCHPLSLVARAKPTWDLETWRPAVGGLRTMLAACNP